LVDTWLTSYVAAREYFLVPEESQMASAMEKEWVSNRV
jgi:hypothetical protein